MLFVLSGFASAQTKYRVLPDDFNVEKSQQMMRAYLRRQVHSAHDKRLNELEDALESPERTSAFQKKQREFMQWTLGEMPNRTPLNALVTGVIKEKGFTIEKVLFESQPGFHVTANVYRPAGKGPFPAVLHPVGHSKNGKAYAEYQRANRLLVQNGFLVLCYDPIGQGERKQRLGKDGKPLNRSTSEHHQLGVAPILLGRSLATYMVWDAVRAVDYLCDRPDVDPDRIGCTGISGGGNLTSFLMAYDKRIFAAAPGCFITTHRRKNESPGPGDAEQNLFAQIRDGFDHPDFILSRAPKPTLILAATSDFVPIEGTWEAFRQSKRLYTRLGFPERVELVEANAKHGFGRRLREATVRFMARWLQGRRLEVFEEPDVRVLADAVLYATPNGHVRKLGNDRSMFELFVEYEKKLASKRPRLTREIIRKVTGIRPLNKLPQPKIESSSTQRDVDELPRKLIFQPEEGILLAALHWPNGDAEPVLLAPAKGMNSVVKEAERLNQRGHPVLIVEVRDTGETKTRNWRFFGADYQIAHMLGRCWLGMWTEDLLICARWLKEKHIVKSVRLFAGGDIGPAALHAAALEPQLVSKVDTYEGLTSWRVLMHVKDAHTYQHVAVQGALRYYDLPDLNRLMNRPDKTKLRGTPKSQGTPKQGLPK